MTNVKQLKVLTQIEVDRYHRAGYHFPLRAVDAAGANRYRDRLEQTEGALGGPLSGSLRNKPHLLFTWLDELIRTETILDAVEDILGPNLLVWSSSFFAKEKRDPGFVSWHQDSTYWGLSEPDVLTVWVALTPSNQANGCMRVMPGTHLMQQLPHQDTFAPNNMLTRGQEVGVDVDPRLAVDIELEPGEFSMHHVLLVHGSEANNSDTRRVGYAIRYVPTYVKQVAGPRDSAMLVRGVDKHGHFDLEPRPRVDLGSDERAVHGRITDEAARILYRGTGKLPAGFATGNGGADATG